MGIGEIDTARKSKALKAETMEHRRTVLGFRVEGLGFRVEGLGCRV